MPSGRPKRKMQTFFVLAGFVVMEMQCFPNLACFGMDGVDVQALPASAAAAAAAVAASELHAKNDNGICLPNCKFPRLCLCENVSMITHNTTDFECKKKNYSGPRRHFFGFVYDWSTRGG
jgi:hypothetical protein